MDRLNHELMSDTMTLCGIDVNKVPKGTEVHLACQCGHPLCEEPITCPLCKSVVEGRTN